MATEFESQELHKESKFSEGNGCQLPSFVGEMVGEKAPWLQPTSAERKLENCDTSAIKTNSGLPCGGVPSFSNKEDAKSSTDSLTSGGIWGQKSDLQMDGVWSAGTGGFDWDWRGATIPDSHGAASALDLSLDFWKPGAIGVSSAWEDSSKSNWGIPDLKTEFNREGLPDKKIGVEPDPAKGIWNTAEERKVEPIGPVQRRSASLTELNVTFESSSLAGEGVKFSSVGKVGANDERSQPDGAEVSQQNREELIAKMINSNEGWGKKPVIQETPWRMESAYVPPPIPDPVPSAAEDSNSTSKDVFWNVPKESGASGWNSNPPAPTSSYEWAPDSDIGMWNGPPPPESVNPNMWTGPPKETSPVWAGGQGGMGQAGLDKGLMQGAGLLWGERGMPMAGGDKFKDFGRDAGLNRSRGADSWGGQQGQRGAPLDGNWTSTESNTWGVPHPAGQQDNWGAKQMNSFPPSSGFNTGSKTDSIQKIGTWGEGMTTETGLWNQPQPLTNMQNTLQQLMDLGIKREDALILQNSMGSDKLWELIKSQKEIDQPRGRIIRGKSMVDVPNDHFGQFQGGRSNNFQVGGGRGSLFQPPIPSGGLPSQMHFKGSGGQQSAGGWSNAYGRASAGVPAVMQQQQQPMGQMNPQMLQCLLHLQSLLQPLLHQRSQVQHSRNLTQMQKNIQIEQLNVHIADLKQRIDQVQLSFGPPPGAAAAPVPAVDAQIDEAKMMQLLSQMKLERDFNPLPHQPFGSINELQMSDGKALGGISANQMAALFGSTQWINPDSSAIKDKLSVSDIMSDTWSNLGQTGASVSKMGWPVSGDFAAPKGSRPPPPPGLGNCEKTDPFWNQQLVGRSTSWAPGERLKPNLPGALGVSSNWLMLKNIGASTDPGLLQKICLAYGHLQNFYYNKMLGQVLVCYINREDAINAMSSIAQNLQSSGAPRLVAESVGVEEIGRLIDSTWTPIPPSALFGSIPPNPKVNSFRGGSAGWGLEGM